MHYHVLLFFKFVGVFMFVGGAVASFVSSVAAERKRAVHSIASPGLLVIWVSGYLLTLKLGISLMELWTLAGLVLSLASQIALVHSAKHDTRSPRAVIAALLPLACVLALMVFRPTWSSL